MSTRSRVGLLTADEVRSIYVHFDGYPEGVGKTLVEHWTDPAEIEKLLDLGDLSILGSSLGEDRGTGYFDRRYTGSDAERQEMQERDECLAYRRDRGETGVDAETHPKDAWPDSGQEFEYLYSNGGWRVRTAAWLRGGVVSEWESI